MCRREELYQKLYAALCGAASDALDLLPDLPENAVGKACLQKALRKAEEDYILWFEQQPMQ